MPFKNWTKVTLFIAITLVGLVVLFSLEGSSRITAQRGNAFVRHVRDFDVDNVGALNPAGLAFSPVVNEFLVLEGGATTTYTDFIRLTPLEELRGFVRMTASITNPINITFDNKYQRLLFFRSARSNLFEVGLDAEGNLDPTSVTPYNIHNTGLQDPQGMVVDPTSGDLFVLDISGPRLLRIQPNPDGGYGNPQFTAIDLGQVGLQEPRGLSLDPTTGNLHIMSMGSDELFEVTQAGEVVAIRNTAEFAIANAQGLVFAPSGDLTDDPQQVSLYLAEPDSREAPGLAAVQAEGASAQSAGRIIELSFVEPNAVAEPSFVASLEQIVDTSNLSPPSPDTAGITYLPATNTLLFSDSEVNEMPLYAGANLFEIGLSGILLDTSSTLDPVVLDGAFKSTGYSKEPTGVSLNPDNGHLFVSDDDKKDIFEVDPGPDGQLHTSADNSVTSFDSTVYGDNDPEGITYGQWQGDLFIVDGVNSEVYHLTAGANGIFDGVPPGGDDPVSSFDTAIYGLLDPEGIAFNSDNGNLYIVGKPANRLFEVTVDGALVQTIDISAANAYKPAGLAYAPSHYNPAVMSIYIVDRGVDNDSDPSENDGKLYELTLPYSTGNHPPVVNAGPDQTITLPGDVTLDGSVTDDGLPAPAALTTLWSKDSGPGTVVFADDTMVDTTAGFSTAGIYNLRLTADDGQWTTSDVVTITVNPELSLNEAPVVDAGPDQSITLPILQVNLVGTVTDDGNPDPPGVTTSTWSLVSGTTGVVFGNPSELETTATFPGAGLYVLRLSASDSEWVTSDEIAVMVTDPASHTMDIRVATSSDDAEERATGGVSLTSTDLELTFDSDEQTVGLRFAEVAIPSGASITKAFLQFTTDETTTEDTNLTIQGQLIDNAPTFTSTTFDVSSRTRTDASVSWTPAPWTIKGEVGLDQQSPDLKAIIQEIVDRPGWMTGNSLALIITGSGKRVAESYDNGTNGAPLLHIDYNVGTPNEPPVANDDSASTAEDTMVIIDVAANDTDPEGDLDPASTNINCATCFLPANGSLVNNGNGTFGYTPDMNFNGPDSFIYEICDALGACDTATVNITVMPTPDPPVANDDEESTQEDVPVTVDVAANDTDPDGNLDPASTNTNCPTCSNPASGTLVNNANGTFNYSPNLGFNGLDSFVYEICDTGGLCDTAAVNLIVTPMNDPPVANDDDAETLEDTAVTIDAAANDDDPDGNLDYSSTNTTCATCSEPNNGSLLNHADGTFEYNPALNFNGSDNFIYEICDTIGACATATVFITVTPVADPPIANDDNVSTFEDTAVIIDVVANDTDADNNIDPTSANTTCINCASPANGSLVNYGDGTFEYTPSSDFSGVDNFVYEVCDSGTPPLCDLGAVSITVDKTAPVVSNVTAAPNPTEGATSVMLSATVTDSALAVTAAEWFIGVDPGVGNGTAMTVSGTGPWDLSATVDVRTWTSGSYTMYVRARDAAGNWSALGSTTLVVDTPLPVFQRLYFSMAGSINPPGVSGTADNSDIYSWDDTAFSRVFDATVYGVPGTANVDGLQWIDTTHLYLSFAGDTTLPGLGAVQDEDVVYYDNGAWSEYFDGTTNGLTADNQDLDAINILGDILYFSTVGNTNPPGVSGTADDADIYSWDGTSFARVWDATVAGVPGTADIDGYSRVDATHFYVSFNNTTTTLPGLGAVADVDIIFNNGGIWAVFFDGAAHGLVAGTNQDIDAFSIVAPPEPDTTGPVTSGISMTPNPSNGTAAVTLSASISDVGTGGSNVVAAEYFIDTIGADGSGAAMSGTFDLPATAANASLSTTLLATLSSGSHTIYVHGQDSAGNWGSTSNMVLVIDKTAPVVSNVTAAPNPTEGATSVMLSATVTDSALAVTAAEWFIGVDPGVGNGTAMTVSGTGPWDLSATVDVRTWTSGSYTMYVRARDAAGNWSALGSTTLVVDTPLPVFQRLYFSMAGSINPPGVSGTADNSDIYSWDDTAFSRVFDATVYGVPGTANVDGLQWIDTTHLYLSFAGDTTLPGLGAVQDEDVVYYDNGAWSEYFDGTTNGLTADNQDLDAINILGDILYFSTVGNTNPPGVSGTADDADIYSWDGTSFARVWDATVAGVPGTADIDGYSRVDATHFYVSFNNTTTTLPGLGAVADVDIIFNNGGIWAVFFDGAAHGLVAGTNQDLDAFDIP